MMPDGGAWDTGQPHEIVPLARPAALEQGPRKITAWVCDECGYWRKDRSTGVHQTFIEASLSEQKRTGSRNVSHALREATFVEVVS